MPKKKPLVAKPRPIVTKHLRIDLRVETHAYDDEQNRERVRLTLGRLDRPTYEVTVLAGEDRRGDDLALAFERMAKKARGL
jgi:hypothetical protein